MGIIQCAADCRYQNDGYCNLNTYAAVTSLEHKCPHYVKSGQSNTASLKYEFPAKSRGIEHDKPEI